jgi:hypothetical protein
MRCKGLVVLLALTLLGFGIAALAGPPDIKELDKALREAIGTRDAKAIEKALYPLVKSGGREGARVILTLAIKLPPGENAIYWQLIRGVSAFRNRDALDETGLFVCKHKKSGMARDIMFAFQNNPSSHVIPLHARILEKGPADLKFLSVDQLANIDHRESVDVLITALQREEKKRTALVGRIQRVLIALTGADCGKAESWAAWWATAREKGLKWHRERSRNTGTVTDHLDPFRAGEFDDLRKIPPERIICLKVKCPLGGCNFDAIEDVLDRMEIPRTVMIKKDFQKDFSCLKKAMALVMNCTMILDH